VDSGNQQRGLIMPNKEEKEIPGPYTLKCPSCKTDHLRVKMVAHRNVIGGRRSLAVCETCLIGLEVAWNIYVPNQYILADMFKPEASKKMLPVRQLDLWVRRKCQQHGSAV